MPFLAKSAICQSHPDWFVLLFLTTNLFHSELFLASHGTETHTQTLRGGEKQTLARTHAQPWPWGRHTTQHNAAQHLEVVDGEHELGKARQLEEEEVAGLEQLAGVAQGVICRGGGAREEVEEETGRRVTSIVVKVSSPGRLPVWLCLSLCCYRLGQMFLLASPN